MGDKPNRTKQYALNEVFAIEREMKVITFTKLLESGEECPEKMKPSDQDGTTYMKKFIEEAKKEGEKKFPKFYLERNQ